MTIRLSTASIQAHSSPHSRNNTVSCMEALSLLSCIRCIQLDSQLIQLIGQSALWNDLSDPLFYGVWLVGFKSAF